MFTQLIQSSATTAVLCVLNNTAAAIPCVIRQPIQTTISAPVALENPAWVASEPQLFLFERHLSVPVMKAPLWLQQRMKALQQRPPPTLQEVETSFRAAEEMR